MLFPGRWGFLCAAFLAVVLCPYRAFAVDKLLIVNGTNLTMKPGQTEPFVGYILVGSDGKIKAIGKGNPPPGMQAQTTYDAQGKVRSPWLHLCAQSSIGECFSRTGYRPICLPIPCPDGLGRSTGNPGTGDQSGGLLLVHPARRPRPPGSRNHLRLQLRLCAQR